jgi:3-oxoacyl-[acyl-carrier protein] reductase
MSPGELDLHGKAALVTGASRGIGAAVARSLAAHGARVGVHYHRDRPAAEAVASGLAGSGHAVLAADLRAADEAAGLAGGAAAALGGLDILVNNAGIYELHDVHALDTAGWRDVWQRTLALNLLAPVHLTFAAIPHLRRAGGGRVVNISSRGAFRGEPEAPAYGAAKAGLNSFSQSMAQALAPDGIVVTVVAPGYVATDMTTDLLVGAHGEAVRRQSPLNRVATPEEVAEVVLWLAAARSDYVTGAIVDVNGASYLRS